MVKCYPKEVQVIQVKGKLPLSSVTQEIPETPSKGVFTSPPPPSLHLTSKPVTANLRLHSSLQAEPYRSSAVKLSKSSDECQNHSGSKVHFPDLEVCCDWSTFSPAQISRGSWGRNE